MKTILAIDPGMETGYIAAECNDTFPIATRFYGQLYGGLRALLLEDDFLWWLKNADTVVCEKFTPRPMARNYRLDELEPIRIEGFIETLRPGVIFRRPEQRFIGRDGQAGMQRVLKSMRLWYSPKHVGRKDANDLRAATMHMVSYLHGSGHEPTIREVLRANS